MTVRTKRAKPPAGQENRPHADSVGGLNDAMDARHEPEDSTIARAIRITGLAVGATIHERLRAARLDIGHIGKEKRNTGIGGGYQFRGIDDALNHVGPVFVRYGITISIEASDLKLTREVVELDNGKERVESHASLKLAVRFLCDHGKDDEIHNWGIEQVSYGEGIDYGSDKAINKAMSAAYKYALFLGLCLPVEPETLPDSDHDAKQPERGRSRSTGGGESQRRSGGKSDDGRPPMKTCPACGAQAVIAGKPEYGGGFVCWKNKGGCGAKFADESELTGDSGPEDAPAQPPADAGKAAFWKFAQACNPPLNKDTAADVWKRHGSNPDRARLEAWCVSKAVEPDFIQAAWDQYGDSRTAIEAIARTIDAVDEIPY